MAAVSSLILVPLSSCRVHVAIGWNHSIPINKERVYWKLLCHRYLWFIKDVYGSANSSKWIKACLHWQYFIVIMPPTVTCDCTSLATTEIGTFLFFVASPKVAKAITVMCRCCQHYRTQTLPIKTQLKLKFQNMYQIIEPWFWN